MAVVIRQTTLNNSTLRSRSFLTSPNLYILASPINPSIPILRTISGW